MDLLYNNWDNVPIGVYNKLREISKEETNGIDKQVDFLSVLCGVTSDEIYNLPMNEVSDLVDKIAWVNDFKFDKNYNSSTIRINGETYDLRMDLNNFTFAQYVDFEGLWSNDEDRDLAGLLSVFIIPRGKKYNDGYDIVELRKKIEQSVPITLAQSVLFFFARRLLISINSTAASLALQTKMERMKFWKKKGKSLNYLKTATQAMKTGTHYLFTSH